MDQSVASGIAEQHVHQLTQDIEAADRLLNTLNLEAVGRLSVILNPEAADRL